MSFFTRAKEPANAPAAPATIDGGRILLARSRLLGRVSAFIFLLAALAVADALQTLVRHEFNSLDIIAGETVLVSGMMPAEATSIEQLRVNYEGGPGLAFEPFETYKGFWMGGFMWRARLTAATDMAPGKSVFTIVDIIKEPSSAENRDERDRAILYGGRQNPALVYAVSVWPDDEARRAADNSIFRRFTGLPAFGVAVGAAVLAIIAGIANWFVFSRAEGALARHGVFYIYGVKNLAVAAKQALPGQKILSDSGYRATFSHLGQPLALGDAVLLLDKQWKVRARGKIFDKDGIKADARFAENVEKPRYGWLIQKVQEQ